MAGANLQVVIQAKDEASKVLQGMAAPIGGLVSSLGAIGLASVGIDSISGAIHGFIDNALEAQSVQSQLNAVLKSTHGVSGMTADSINAIANSLSRVTPFEDEAIGGAENLLLTFTSIGKDVFPQATEAILNMSQSLGQDLQSSTIQLGKALNDPIKGITALSRVGVSFTEAQKKSIEQMVKAGNIMGAQKVILKELDTEFGGAAKAAGETFAGKMKILETQIGNVKEAIGGPLIGVLGDLATQAMPAINAFADGLPNAIADATATLQDFIPRIVLFGNDIIAAVSDFVKSGDIESLLASLNDYFIDAFDISPGEVLANLGQLVAPIVDWIKGTALSLAQAVLTWDAALISWIVPMIPGFLAELQRFAAEWFAWIKAEVPILEAQIIAWATPWIAWISALIPPFIAEFNRLVGEWLAWIQAQAAPLIAQLQVWGQSFIAWIGPATVQFLAQWPGMLNKFLDWIGAQAAPILLKLGEWGLAFVQWIAPRIPGILEALGGIALAIVVFILETAGTIALKLLEWGIAFVKWVAPQIPGLIAELKLMGAAMVEWMQGELTVLGDEAYDWGRNVVNRFLEGFHSMSLSDVLNLAAPTPGSPISNALGLPGPAASGAVGSVSGYSAGDVHVHIYGSQSNPAQIQSAATSGVLAAQRARGY